MTLTDVNSHILLLFFFFAIYFIGLIGWQTELVRIGRHTGAVLGGYLRQRKETDTHMYVTILFFFFFLSICSFYSFSQPEVCEL